MSMSSGSGDDEGFTLIELLVATVVFAILATGFAATLSSALRSFRSSKARTVAEQVASSQLEDARRLAYGDLGTVGGNPPGLIEPFRTMTSGGQQLNVVARVSYVNDPLPSGVETGANYKSVQVTVSRPGASTPLAEMATLVAPPLEPSLDKGLMKVKVVDFALNVAVSGATVALGSGPDAPLSDTTNADGEVSFAALEPTTANGATSKYELTVGASGYATVPEDLPPAPAASTSLAAGQVFSTDLHVYKPVTLNVHLVDSLGAPFVGPATVSVSSSRGAGSLSVTGGSASVSHMGGAPLLPGVLYSVGASAAGGIFSAGTTSLAASSYPSILSADVTLVMAPYVTGQLEVKLKDSGGAKVVGASVVVSGGPASISVSGVTDNTGTATITVPAGTTPAYTLVAPARSGYGQATTTSAGPTALGTVTVNLTVPTP
jgi:prepilin-type N-terminal cleavage/methylation domain-containing protein